MDSLLVVTRPEGNSISLITPIPKLFPYSLLLGLYWDNGKENGNYYSILGLYRDNGKENGNYYSILAPLGNW